MRGARRHRHRRGSSSSRTRPQQGQRSSIDQSPGVSTGRGLPAGRQGLRVVGVVEEALPDANFRVKLEDGRMVLAHLAGRLRVRFIRVLTGDRVAVELSPYDESRGRIVYRGR